jgi:hypothetical protein
LIGTSSVARLVRAICRVRANCSGVSSVGRTVALTAKLATPFAIRPVADVGRHASKITSGE